MNDIDTTTPPLPGVERLLASLTGVFSAHVVTGPEGTLREIHVLATPELHPKQVVRNVESALSAGLGIEIDRRIVSVAQLRPGAIPDDPDDDDPTPDPTPTRRRDSKTRPAIPASPSAPTDRAVAAPDRPRIILLGHDARLDASRRASCRVTLRAGPDEFSGEGHGPDTVRGRAEAAAVATFAALAACRGQDRLGLEGVAVVETNGKSYVLVAARALNGRRATPLVGTAFLDRSPEEAAILASLQATNRWRASV